MTVTRAAFSWPVRLLRAARYRAAAAQGATRLRNVRRAIAAGGALRGKIAVITGAGAGIGRATALSFARAGAHCVLITIDPHEGGDLADAFARENLSGELFIADVADEAQVNDAAKTVKNGYSRIDILVNNAGVRLDEDFRLPPSGLSDATIRRTLDVNVLGAIHMSRALLDAIPRGGRIINVSSVMGRLNHRPDGTSAAYMLSKAALNSYTRSLAFELQARGIMVDCVHPGWVKTPLGGPQAQIAPEDAIDMTFYLATREASETTGCFWKDGRVVEW